MYQMLFGSCPSVENAPIREGGTCGHEHDDDRAADGFAAERGLDSARVVIGHDDADALHDAEQNGDVSGDLGHLRPALFALLGEPFERGYDQCQQLHDDEAVDERQYAECKQRTVSERAARHHVDDLEQRVASVAVDRRGDRREIKTGNGDVAAYPVHQQDRKRKEYFVADAFVSESVFDCLPHDQISSALPPALTMASLAD